MNNNALFRKSSLSLAIGMVLAGPQAYATCSTETALNLTVTSLDDVIDPNDGVLTLREALTPSSGGAPYDRDTCTNPDVITFSSDLNGGTLNITNNWLAVAGAQNVVITTEESARITIKTANANQALLAVNEDGTAVLENMVFDGGEVLRNYPLLDISGSSGVTIKNSEVKNYRRPTSQLYTNATGAITAQNCADLRIENSSFDNNIGNKGGALTAIDSPLTIVDSSFTNNQVDGGEGTSANGGAVFFIATSSNTLTINDSVFNGNKAQLNGAAGQGGALFAIGDDIKIEINDSQFSNNLVNAPTYSNDGGALNVEGANILLTIDNSQFTNNSTDTDGGAIDIQGSGCSMNLHNSAFFGNTAGEMGGAIRANECTLNIIQSTISSNTAAQGGGIYNSGASSTALTQSTITRNSASILAGALYSDVTPQPSLDCSHSVIADNNDTDPDFIAIGFSGSTDHCYINNSAMLGDQIGYVHIPETGSPLIDAGDPNYVPYSDTDQRGDKRVRGSSIDIGAAESGNTAPSRAITDQPVIQLQPGVNEFDTTTELGIVDDDNILIYSLQTVGNGLSVTEDSLLTIDTTVDGAWTNNVTMDTDGLIVLELTDGFNTQEIEIKISGVDSDSDGTADHLDNDRDGDGIENTLDAFPDDATETADTDGDGVGDNADAFPNDATETDDSDGDGVGDHADAFPNDATETVDSDGDGVGDNADTFPNDAAESVDSDGDSVGDNADAFPNDATETTDSDGDGVGDNSDAFPNDPTRSVVEGTTGGTNDTATADNNLDGGTDTTADSDGSGGGSTGIFALLSLVLVRLMRRR